MAQVILNPIYALKTQARRFQLYGVSKVRNNYNSLEDQEASCSPPVQDQGMVSALFWDVCATFRSTEGF